MSEFWKEQVVFITGITGFVGSWLAKALIEKGSRVVGLVRDLNPYSNFHFLNLDRQVISIRGTLNDYQLLVRILNEYEIDCCFHLAAQAIVGAANRSPLSTFKSNIEGTWNILEACRLSGVDRAIVASSDKAYGNQDNLPYHEDDCLNPSYPYDVSKACADFIARSYYHTFDLPVVVTRFANIYGGGDLNFSRIIPGSIRDVLEERDPVIRSDGTPVRDFIYIEDAVDLYLRLAENVHNSAIKGEAFNAGSGEPISMLDLVKLILQISDNRNLSPDIQGKSKPKAEIDRQFLDSTKVKERLGWEPAYNLGRGLSKTYNWYQKYLPELKKP